MKISFFKYNLYICNNCKNEQLLDFLILIIKISVI